LRKCPCRKTIFVLDSPSGLSTGAIVGIVVSVLTLLAVGVAAVFRLFWTRYRRPAAVTAEKRSTAEERNTSERETDKD